MKHRLIRWAARRTSFVGSCLCTISLLGMAGTTVAAVVGDQVELKASHQAGVSFHSGPGGTPTFQRVPDGTVGTVKNLARDGRWIELRLADACTGGVAARYVGHTVAGSPPPDLSAERTVWTSPEDCQQVVGSGGLGMWLITTSEGHMLLNTSMPGSGPMIEASVRKLHFDPKDIKLILTCHGHNDHVGRHKYLRALTGVKVAMIAEEAELLRSGGTTDFHTGTVPIFGFDGAEVWSRPS